MNIKEDSELEQETWLDHQDELEYDSKIKLHDELLDNALFEPHDELSYEPQNEPSYEPLSALFVEQEKNCRTKPKGCSQQFS